MKVRKLNPEAIIPNKGTKYSAGFDLHALVSGAEIAIKPNETNTIHTGIAVEIPIGYFGAIFARGGTAKKKGLRPSSCIGIINPDNRDEIRVNLRNDSKITQYIKNGDRVAQLVIIPCLDVNLEVVEDLEAK